jgi:mannose-6-phosphate isomerase-like protein (cupin superfamily)
MAFNIVISLAGRSERFFNEGFTKPKYYLPMIHGKTMIEMAIDSLNIPGILYLILQKEHCEKYQIDKFLQEKYPNAILCYLDRYTDGSAESCYIATKEYIDNDTPLIISNCDQSLEWDSTDFINSTLSSDGAILTYYANTTRNSYAAVKDNSSIVVKVAEKEIISNNSLVGVHGWKRGSDFCRSVEHIMKYNIRANNEYYVSITYNYLIELGKSINIVPLKECSGEKYWTVGTPETYYQYLEAVYGSVKVNRLDAMTRGWLIGDFKPSILRTSQFEVGYLSHKKGEIWPAHVHNQADEYNVLIRGSMQLNNELLSQGEIFIIKKGMLAKAMFFEDCEVLCIKCPSIPSDKVCY